MTRVATAIRADPSTRLAKATGLQLLICLKHGVWGATRNRLQKWRVGDQLVILSDSDYCGLAEVIGQPFTSEDLIFDGGFYPYRIPIDFRHVVGPADVAAVAADIRAIMTERFGSRFGWPILMQHPLPNELRNAALNAVRSRPDVLADVRRHLEHYLEDAMSKGKPAQFRPGG